MTIEYNTINSESEEAQTLIKRVDDKLKAIINQAIAQDAKSFEGIYFDETGTMHGIIDED